MPGQGQEQRLGQGRGRGRGEWQAGRLAAGGRRQGCHFKWRCECGHFNENNKSSSLAASESHCTAK